MAYTADTQRALFIAKYGTTQPRFNADYLVQKFWPGQGYATPPQGAALQAFYEAELTRLEETPTGSLHVDENLYWDTVDLWVTPTFFDDFETGDTSKWVTTTGSPAVHADYAYEGSYGAVIDPTEGIDNKTLGTSTTKWDQDTYPWFSVDAYFKIVSFTADESISLLTVQNSEGAAHFDFFQNGATGLWEVDTVNTTGLTQTAGTVGEWHRFQARCNFGVDTYPCQVMIDGAAMGVGSFEDGAEGRTPGHVRSLILGQGTDTTNITYFDNVKIQVGATDPGWLT